jgi:hypothetical protein
MVRRGSVDSVSACSKAGPSSILGSAPQGGSSHWAFKRWRDGERPQQMATDKCIVWMIEWMYVCYKKNIWKINKKSGILPPNLKITNIPVFYKAFGLNYFDEGKSISQAIGRMLLHNVKQHNVNITWCNVTKHKRHITYSVTKWTPLHFVKFTLHKRYKTDVCFVTLYIMWPSGFDTFMFRLLMLCAATLSNLQVV